MLELINVLKSFVRELFDPTTKNTYYIQDNARYPFVSRGDRESMLAYPLEGIRLISSHRKEFWILSFFP
jgi:hypothetical protein